MKKNMFLHASKAVAGALVFALVFTACQKDLKREGNSEEIILAKGGTSSGNRDVYLEVTAEDREGDQIRSDGKGKYSNGVDRVEARIRSTDGNFFMITNNAFKPALRTWKFPFNPTRFEDKRDYRLVTKCITWLQNMEDNSSQIIPFTIWAYVDKSTLDFKIRFDNGLYNTTDNVKVTRLDTNTWTIEPANVTDVLPSNAMLTDGNNALIGSGYHQLPFKLTLKRKI